MKNIAYIAALVAVVGVCNFLPPLRPLKPCSITDYATFPQAANATGTRTFNSPVRPFRLLAKQFAANANVFTIVDPTKDGTPLALANATGRSGMDGSVTVSVQSGFTAPLALTAFFWQRDNVTTTNSGWTRLAPVATGGSSNYTQSIDAHYASCMFQIPENTPFLIMADKAVTGNVYIDAGIEPSNPNSEVGYPDR